MHHEGCQLMHTDCCISEILNNLFTKESHEIYASMYYLEGCWAIKWAAGFYFLLSSYE